MNPIQQAIAVIRQRPVLAVAGVGAMAAAVIVARGSAPDAPADTAAGASGSSYGGIPPSSLPGYGTGPVFAGGDLAASDLAAAIREGNALVVNNLAQLANAIAASEPAPPKYTIPTPVGPGSPRPPAGPGPVSPPATPVTTPRIVSRSTLTERARQELATRGRTVITYTVRPGDTLSGIAARFGQPGGWQQLYVNNRAAVGSNPNLIHPGLVLGVTVTRKGSI